MTTTDLLPMLQNSKLLVFQIQKTSLLNSFNSRSIGNEYEIRLRMELEEKKITFLHEDHLRARGYDKTPDIKLEIPIG